MKFSKFQRPVFFQLFSLKFSAIVSFLGANSENWHTERSLFALTFHNELDRNANGHVNPGDDPCIGLHRIEIWSSHLADYDSLLGCIFLRRIGKIAYI